MADNNLIVEEWRLDLDDQFNVRLVKTIGGYLKAVVIFKILRYLTDSRTDHMAYVYELFSREKILIRI